MIRFYPLAYHLYEGKKSIYVVLWAYDIHGNKISIRFPYNHWFYAEITEKNSYSDLRDILELCLGVSIDDPDTIRARYSTRDLHVMKPVIKVRCKTFKAKRDALARLSEFNIQVHESDDKLDPILKFLAERNLSRYQWMEADLYPVSIRITTWSNEYEGVVDTLRSVEEDILAPELSIASWDIETNSHQWNKFPDPITHPDNYISMIAVTFWSNEEYQEHILIYGPRIEAPYGPSMEERGIKVHTFDYEIDLIRGFLDLVKSLDPDILVGHNIFGFDIKYVTKRHSQSIRSSMANPRYKGTRDSHISNISRLQNWPCPIRPVEWNNSQFAVNGEYIDLPGRIWLDTQIIAARNYFGPLKNNKLDTLGLVILGMPKNDMHHKEMFRIFKFHSEWRALEGHTPDHPMMVNLAERVKDAYKEHVETYNKTLPPRPGTVAMNHVIDLQSMANVLDQRGSKRKILMAKDVPMDRDEAQKMLDTKYEALRTECESLIKTWNIPLQDLSTENMIRTLWWFVAMYCVQDTRIPFQLLRKQSIVPVLREQASIYAVDVAEVLIKGQIYATTCAQYAYVYDMGFMMDFGPPGGPTGGSGYKGGFVADCVPGLKIKDNNSMMFVLDFASLYPTVMIAHNVCYSTWIPEVSRLPEHPQYIWNLYEQHIMTKIESLKSKDGRTEDETKDLETLQRIVAMPFKDRGRAMCDIHNFEGLSGEHWFLKSCVMHGILSHMLWRKYISRKEIKAKMAKAKKEGNLAMATTYNAQQLAVKVFMNASYGALGTATNRLANYPAAEVTTALGRNCIQTCNKLLQQWGEDEVVYNDTDSAMILMTRLRERFGMDPVKIRAHGHEVAKRLSGHFPRPMGMECENFFISFLLKAKKNYAAIKWDESSMDIHHYTWSYVNAQGLLYIKGLAPVRNDKYALNKRLFTDILYLILARYPLNVITTRMERTIEYIWSFSKPGSINKENIQKVASLFSYNMGLTPSAFRGNNSAMSGWANKYAALYGQKPGPGERFELVVACPTGPISKESLGSNVKHSKSTDSLTLPEWLLDPLQKRQLDIIHYLLCFNGDGNIISLMNMAFPDHVPKDCMTKYYIPILIEQGRIPPL